MCPCVLVVSMLFLSCIVVVVGSSIATHVVVDPHGYDVEWLLCCFRCGSWLRVVVVDRYAMPVVNVHLHLQLCIVRLHVQLYPL